MQASEPNLTPDQHAELVAIVSEHFDEAFYAKANPDVALQGNDLKGHFILYGLYEGRAPNASTSATTLRGHMSQAFGALPSREDLRGAYQIHYDSGRFLRRFLRSARDLISGRQASDEAKGANAASTLSDALNLVVFNAANAAGYVFSDHEDAVAYLLSEGYRTLDPLSFELAPKMDFHIAFYDDRKDMSHEDAYLDWLQYGRLEGRFISPGQMLDFLGLPMSMRIEDFDARAYLASYPDLPNDWSAGRALFHFLTDGITQRRFHFEMNPPLFRAVEARLKRLYHSDPSTAIAAAEHLLASGYESVSLSILVARNMILANHLLAASRTVQGLSTSVPSDQFWLKYCQADVQKRLSNFDVAAEQMNAALALENDSLWAQGELESVLQARLEQAEKNAKTAADSENYGPARLLLDRAIDQCFQSLQFYGVDALDLPPASPPKGRPMRIGFLADTFLPQCKLYRVDQKVEQLKAAGVDVECFDFRTQLADALNRAGFFDALIVYRVPPWFHILRLIKLVRSLGRPVIYEIDDLLVDPEHYPEPLSAFDASITSEDYAGLVLSTSQNAGVARHCDYAIASTPPLAAELSKLVRTGKAFVHRNALSSPHFKAMANAVPPPRERSTDRVRIFYGSGTKAHKDYLEDVFFSGLADVMEALPQVDFVGVGFVPSKGLSERFGDRIILHEPIWDPVAYWGLLATCHINVAVLKPSLLTDCKSEIKWMEAAMVGVPTVMSPTATLAEVAEEGRTALFASNVGEWRAQMSRLVQAPDVRNRVAAAARQEVLDRYNLPDMAEGLKDNLQAVLAHHVGGGGMP